MEKTSAHFFMCIPKKIGSIGFRDMHAFHIHSKNESQSTKLRLKKFAIVWVYSSFNEIRALRIALLSSRKKA
jgi:hypothetical protein